VRARARESVVRTSAGPRHQAPTRRIRPRGWGSPSRARACARECRAHLGRPSASFTLGHLARNPPWEADELVLALDVYFRVPDARRSKTHPEIAELSKTLRALPLPLDRPEPAKFRDVNGTFLKLQNFKALDPEYTASGRVGMRRGATGREQALWDRFVANQDELRELAARIREGSASATLLSAPEDDEAGVLEGTRSRFTHSRVARLRVSLTSPYCVQTVTARCTELSPRFLWRR
jgi:predicted HNH restriction endonuclease